MLGIGPLSTALAPADHSALIAGIFSVIIALIGGAFAWYSGRHPGKPSGGAGTSALTDIIAELHDERDEWEDRARALGWKDSP